MVEVNFFDMRKTLQKGFCHLKETIDAQKRVIVIICGGDGTVMWVISELSRHGIDHRRTPLAIVPLGTGNDFSRNLGWGKSESSLLENNFAGLKQLVVDCLAAGEEWFDLWDVQAEVCEEGYLEKVQDGKDCRLPQKTLKKHFCNYFSFGIDARIGYQFDKRRTSSRLGNLAVYGAVGLITGAANMPTVGELVEAMATLEGGEQQIIFKGDSKGFFGHIGPNPFDISLNNFLEGVKSVTSFHKNQNILALNINSYMGGVTDIWKKAKENPHVLPLKDEKQPSHSDAKLEFVSFSNTTSIGMEKAFGKVSQFGFAERITQGGGPFVFRFRTQEKEQCTYLQIDGEFFKTVNPQCVTVRLSSLFEPPRVRVLRKGEGL